MNHTMHFTDVLAMITGSSNDQVDEMDELLNASIILQNVYRLRVKGIIIYLGLSYSL